MYISLPCKLLSGTLYHENITFEIGRFAGLHSNIVCHHGGVHDRASQALVGSAYGGKRISHPPKLGHVPIGLSLYTGAGGEE
jgi:hypothetical protein